MKQNSSILFHVMPKSLRFRYLLVVLGALLCTLGAAFGADVPEYLASFSPAKGFKPAQRDLTEVYLQLAGSLEYYGSPEPYLRHVAAEHVRIEDLYRQKFGKQPTSFRPNYLDDAYIDGFSRNWDHLSAKLGLSPYAKEIGNEMRDAIKGTRGTGTTIVDIFNRHQAAIFDAIDGKGGKDAGFSSLREELARRLELYKRPANYENYEIARRDAISFALGIQGMTEKLFARIDQLLKPADADRVKAFLTSAFMDVGEMADSELEAGISEWALGKASTAAK